MRFITFILPLLALVVSQVSSAPIPQPGGENTLIDFPPVAQNPRIHRSNLLARPLSERPTIPIGKLVYRRNTPYPLEARSIPPLAPTLVKRMSIGEKIKNAFRSFGEKVKKGFQHVGKKIKEGFQNFGHKVRQGFHKVKKAFQHAGHKIKQGFQTAGRWLKENGKKIGKFIVKAAAAATSIAGRIVSFIPVVGKGIGRAMQVAAKGMSAGADRIKAHMGNKLEKGMKVMSGIVNPGSAIAGAIKGKGGKALGKLINIITKRDFEEQHLMARELQGGKMLFRRDYA